MKHFCSFSEAIREGLLTTAPTRGALRTLDGGACAIGAGLIATGYPVPTESACAVEILRAYGFAEQQFPYLTNRAGCPACEAKDNLNATNVIWHLNDDHRWTREQIADWLEAEEEKLGYVTLVESESPEVETVAAFRG